MNTASEIVAEINGTSAAACFAVLLFFSVSACLGRLFSFVLKLKWRHPLLRFFAELVMGMDLLALGLLLLKLISGPGRIPSAAVCGACLFLPFGIWLILGSLSACLHGFFPLRKGKRGGKARRSGSPLQTEGKNAFRTRSSGRRGCLKQALPLLLIVLPLCLYGASAFCPAAAWDELVYQIALPFRWSGGVSAAAAAGGGETLFYPDLPYSAFPSLAQFAALLILEYSGALGMKLFSFCTVLLLTGRVYTLLRLQCSSRRTASIFCFCLLTSPIFSELLMKDFYVEPLIALHFVAALALLKGCRGGPGETGSGEARKAMAAGWICGGMGALKLNALPLVFCIALLGAFRKKGGNGGEGKMGVKGERNGTPEEASGKEKGRNLRNFLPVRRKGDMSSARDRAKFLFSFFLMFLLCIFLFYLRPWVETGNPFYPYFGAWGPGEAETAVAASSEFHHAISTGKYGIGQPLLSLAAGAVFVTLREFRGIYDGSYGMQFLLLLLCWGASLLAALRRRARRNGNGKTDAGAGTEKENRGGAVVWREEYLPDFCLIFLYFCWCFSSQQARFLLPAAVLLLLLAARCFRAPENLTAARGRRGRVLSWLLLALSLVSFTPGAARHYLLCWRYVFDRGLRPVDYVLSAMNPGYVELIDALSAEPGKKTLLLFEERTLYLPPACRVGTPFFQPELFTPPESAGSVAETLEKGGYERMVFRAPENCPDMMPKYLERSLPLVERLGREIASGRLKIVRTLPGGYFLLEPSAGR